MDFKTFLKSNRSVALLVVCQALYLCASAIGLTLTGLVGAMLAPTRSLATLPFALVTVATALTTIPVSLSMVKWGRKPLFLLGSLSGIFGGCLATWAIVHTSFLWFCIANLFLGLFQASAQYYRFAATEAADTKFRSRAIGLVIAGGVVAALVGPTLAAWARDVLAPHAFAGSYLAVLVLSATSALVLSRLELPSVTPGPVETTATPLRAFVKNPDFVAAIANSALGYATMVFVMTATPLAVLGCGLTVGNAASVIQWHLLCMFAPGFFTGRLIARWGVNSILLAGTSLFVLGGMVALEGTSLPNFAAALALYGLAWNFSFVGGTTLLMQSLAHASSADRARAQAANEFITFAAVAIGSLLAGATYEVGGWNAVHLIVFPLSAVTFSLTMRAALKNKRSTQ